jgi:hypothetical protein
MKNRSSSSRAATLGTWVWVALMLSACGPRNFVKSPTAPWTTVLVRPGITYDRVWDQTVDLLVKHFDIEVLSKEDGYIRSDWMYRWTGETTEDYRVRVTVKFSPDRSRCEVKSEAEWGGPGEWILGTDRRLEREMQDALRDRIGRAVASS